MSNYRDYILKGKDVAVFEIDTDPISLDPAKCDDYIGQIISQAMFEPLFIRDIEFEDFVIRHEQREYDLCLALLSPLYNDPFNYFQYFLSELSEEDEDEFIDILQKALGDEKENHCTYYKKANDYLLEKLPSIPLFNGQSIFLKNPFLKGYKIFKDGSISIQNLSWGTEEKPKL